MEACPSPLTAVHRSISLPSFTIQHFPIFQENRLPFPLCPGVSPKTPPVRKGKEKVGPGRSEEHLFGTEYYLI